MVATIMRQIGLHEDTITLSSREQQPRTQERFEVFVPIRGAELSPSRRRSAGSRSSPTPMARSRSAPSM